MHLFLPVFETSFTSDFSVCLCVMPFLCLCGLISMCYGELFMNYAAWFKVLQFIRSLDVVRMETKGLCVTRDGHYRLMNERLKVCI